MQVVGGQIIQSNGNPVFPGTHVTGPLLAGNIKDGDGGSGLAGLGSTNPGNLANVGYARMSQAGRVLQVAAPGFASPDLIIPAQSLILSMTLVGLVAFTGAIGLGISGSAPGAATFFTAAGAVTAPPVGTDAIPPPTAQPFVGNWLNVGPQDVQILVTSASAGGGVGVLIVDYIQGINAATS